MYTYNIFWDAAVPQHVGLVTAVSHSKTSRSRNPRVEKFEGFPFSGGIFRVEFVPVPGSFERSIKRAI